MIADETPPEIRGRAFGLRQALDTVGALLAPLAAVGADGLVRQRHPRGLLDRGHPGRLLVPARLARAARTRAAAARRSSARRSSPAFATSTRRPSGCSRSASCSALARFSEGFLILKGIEVGLSRSLSPLTLALFNLAYVALAYPAGSLSDRMSPRVDPDGGHRGAGRRQPRARRERSSLLGWSLGVGLWGAHMALTQGIFSRMIADSAPEDLRATSFGAFCSSAASRRCSPASAPACCGTATAAAATFVASAGVAAVALAMLSLLPEDARPEPDDHGSSTGS